METTSIILQSLCIPCGCHCRYCLLSWHNQPIGADYVHSKSNGSHALEMLCSLAKEIGISELYDDIAVDNPPLFLKHGFTEEWRMEKTVLLKKIL